jgi:hypothetical protein
MEPMRQVICFFWRNRVKKLQQSFITIISYIVFFFGAFILMVVQHSKSHEWRTSDVLEIGF